jgi:Arc/MetJ-type ribon-helix-helix transcriptional regulator
LPRTYVETSTFLLEEVDEMVQEGYYHDRTEAVNEALRLLIKQYKLSKLHAKDARVAAASGAIPSDGLPDGPPAPGPRAESESRAPGTDSA